MDAWEREVKFNHDNAVGEQGEKIFETLLKSSEKTASVIPVSKDPYFQSKDIDYLQVRTDGSIVKYEVKTDTMAHRTGNLAYETITGGHEGCMVKTEADYVAYLLIETNEIYLFPVDKMREYVATRTDLKLISMGDCAKGYLLSIEDLLQAQIMLKIR